MKPLNPIMAVLAIASVGAMPLRALAADGKTATVTTTDEKNPVNLLAKALAASAGARADAGKRFADFLLEPDAQKRSFIADGVDKKALGDQARAWGETVGPVGSVAMLYFVAGPGAATPAWAATDPILAKTFVPGMKWEGNLRIKLSDWSGKGQITKAMEAKSATAFLLDAAAKASEVFSDPRTKKEIDLSIAGNDVTAPVIPDTQRNPAARFDGASRQYTLQDLYTDGGIVADIAGPKDKNSRKISVKIYSTRQDDGTIVNEIGIFDITDTNDIYGRRFPLDSGKQSFALDDRSPGHKTYELNFGEADKNGDRTVEFTRPGGGVAIKTSVSDLLLRRADQARAMGNMVKINGQEFYTLPQGGEKSVLNLFPKSVIDERGMGDPRDLVPALYAEVGERGADGRNKNPKAGPKGGPHLGTVGKKDYHLVFNKDLGVWEVAEGAGDLPEKPKKPEATDGTVTPGGTTGNSGVTTTPGDTIPVGGVPAADIEGLLLKSPDCVKNPDDTKYIAENLKGKYGIISCKTDTAIKQILIVPWSEKNPKQQMEYGSVPGFQLQRIRIVDHYLVMQFDKQVQYLDLLKNGKDEQGNDSGFLLSGLVTNEDKNARDFLVKPVPNGFAFFLDALRNYVGVTSADAGVYDAVPKRVKQILGDKPATMTASWPVDPKTSKAYLGVNASGLTDKGDKAFMVWPDLVVDGQPVAAASPYTSLGGPTNAMDAAVSSVDEAFPTEVLLPESRKATAMTGRVQTDIAMYESVDTPKKYFLMFKYYAMDPTEPNKPDGPKEKKVFRQKQFEVFSDANPLPANFGLQGLMSGAVVLDRVLSGPPRFLQNSSKTKGVLALFQNKQVEGDNQKDKKANCVGPLVWWGLADRDAAQKACEADKL